MRFRSHEKLTSRFKMISSWIWILSFLCAGWQGALADPFNSYPGSRAKAMGGAFTAVADDASAVWYNPAGLAPGKDEEDAESEEVFQADLVMEWSQAASIDSENGDLGTDNNAFFVGGMVDAPEFGVGLFYYTPYVISYWAQDAGDSQTAWGKVDQSVQVVSLPVGAALMEGKMKVGASVEWVHLGTGDSDIVYRDEYGWADEYGLDSSTADGVSGSAGLMLTLMDNAPLPFKLDFGAVARMPSTSDIDTGAEDATSALFFNKPTSFEAGLSLTKAFTEADFPAALPASSDEENDSQAEAEAEPEYTLIIAAQYGREDWGEAADADWSLVYDRVSVGFELAVADADAVLKKTAIRGGYYYANPSGDDVIWDWPVVQGITTGIGMEVGEEPGQGLVWDITGEYRILDNDAGTQDVFLLSTGIKYVF